MCTSTIIYSRQKDVSKGVMPLLSEVTQVIKGIRSNTNLSDWHQQWQIAGQVFYQSTKDKNKGANS